jgi:hypothetical protein
MGSALPSDALATWQRMVIQLGRREKAFHGRRIFERKDSDFRKVLR